MAQTKRADIVALRRLLRGERIYGINKQAASPDWAERLARLRARRTGTCPQCQQSGCEGKCSQTKQAALGTTSLKGTTGSRSMTMPKQPGGGYIKQEGRSPSADFPKLLGRMSVTPQAPAQTPYTGEPGTTNL